MTLENDPQQKHCCEPEQRGLQFLAAFHLHSRNTAVWRQRVCVRDTEIWSLGIIYKWEKKESFMPATHRHPVQMGSVCVRQAAINTRGAVCSRRGAAKKRLYIAQTDSRRVYITAFISLLFRSCTGCSFGSRSHRSCSGSD